MPTPPDNPRLPILALPGSVVFPGAVTSLEVPWVESPGTLAALTSREPRLLAVPTYQPGLPARPADIGPVATLARLLTAESLSSHTRLIVLQGLERVMLEDVTDRGGLLAARFLSMPRVSAAPEAEAVALQRTLELIEHLAAVEPRCPSELLLALSRQEVTAERCVDLIAIHLPLSQETALQLLEETSALERLQLAQGLLEREIERSARLGARPFEDALPLRSAAEPRRGLRASWAQPDPVEAEARGFEARIERADLPETAREQALHEIACLRRTAAGSAEFSRGRAWLHWMLELPWTRSSPGPEKDQAGFEGVAEALNLSHTSLADVKNRIIEFLAVCELGGASRGTVLCFLGPPGTGKTSMGRAVAQALGRTFVHIPLGGITEESELSGLHYSQPGAMPGLVLQGISRAGTRNPVILIDEIDKVQFGATGETGGALLQILDPEYNREFLDQYLGAPFDLSECVFLATANDTEEMPEALLDRLEVIDFSSYTEREKLLIARDHLIPRARENAGLDRSQFRVSRGAQLSIIRSYTEEAGVRHLQRMLDSLARKAALRVVSGGQSLFVRKADLLSLLGPALVDEELRLERSRVGVSVGLAWTSAGGSLLPIEAVALPGSGRTILTGSVGEVMRESVQTAISFVRSCFKELGLAHDLLDGLDLHLHFPGGATPKDGPSAGIAIATSLASLLTRTPARHDVALTGEMSLHGAVLPVGGMRDKLLAALRAGIRSVVVPARNSEEILRLPPEVRQHLTIHLVHEVREVFALALALNRRSRMRKAFAPPLRRRGAAKRARENPGPSGREQAT